MKKTLILSAIAIVLLAVTVNLWILSLLVIIPVVNYFINKREKNPMVQEIAGKRYATVEEVEQQYGKPDDVVVLDATRANELGSLILSYPERSLFIMAGREVPMSDITGISPKNMAIVPYTVDEYAVVINTKNPIYPVLHLRVGYDLAYAQEVASQIYCILQQFRSEVTFGNPTEQQ